MSPQNTTLSVQPVTLDPWIALRSATTARIALGRAGGSLPTREWLKFKADHAVAREAVHFPFDAEQLAGEIARLGVEVVTVTTAAANRRMYLERPDFGRQLDERSRYELQQMRSAAKFDLTISVSDGLSAVAVHRQVCPLLAVLLSKLKQAEWQLSPVVVAKLGRVALEDEIGQVLNAQLALMLIGEHPDLDHQIA